VLLRGRSRVHLKIRDLHIDWSTIWRILKIGFPSSIQMTLRGLMGIVLIAIVASFGTAAVAAYGIGLRLNMLLMMPGFALGMAAATMVGQNLGAKLPERAIASVWAAVRYYTIFMVFMTLAYFFLAPQLIMIFNHEADVVSIGTLFLKIVAFGNPLIALGLILDRSLAGAGDTMITMTNTFIALWLLQIPLAFYLSHMTGLGITGIWIAMLIAQALLTALNTFWFQAGRWKHKKI
jgi:putative MATE family efflux protein